MESGGSLRVDFSMARPVGGKVLFLMSPGLKWFMTASQSETEDM